jgi:tRNA pseudouridine55 synthase
MAKLEFDRREVSGIVLLDKPQGITSNRALQNVKRLFRAKKAGHTGSLDPLATGLLPVCLGEATKVSGFLLSANKTYQVECKLGVRTNSADATGDVISERQVGDINTLAITQVLGSFTGEINQIPPMHSAIKINGVPLYKLAHQGREIERKARKVTVFSFNNVYLIDDNMGFEVQCSKGTYVRTLVDDIGEQLGCGSHVTALRRTKVGPFCEDAMISFPQLESLANLGEGDLDSRIIKTEQALCDWPSIRLPSDAAHYISQGQAVYVDKIGQNSESNNRLVRLYSNEDHFMGIGHILDDGRVAPKRLLNISKMG